MKRIILIVLTTICIDSFSQKLEIGQAVPDLEVGHVINYNSNRLKLSNYKGKLVILDFWGTSCSSCISAFPKIDALQKKYADVLQIIAVNRESEDSTKKFFKKHPKIRMPKIPFVTEDTLLKKYFPSKFYPWHVWIDKNGTVRHITQGYNATSENIEAFLNGKKMDIIELQYQTPNELYTARTEKTPLEKAEFYSLIVPYQPVTYIRNLSQTDPSSGKLVRISRHSVSVVQLFKQAFEEAGKYSFQLFDPRFSNNVILDFKDTFRYVFPSNPQKYDWWYANYGFDFDLKVPPRLSDQIFKIMQQDLQRFFGLKAWVEKRNVRCLVLQRIPGENKIQTKGGSPATNLGRGDKVETYFINQPFSVFFNFLKDVINYQNLSTPLVDGTDYKGNVDFSIKVEHAFDLGEVKRVLNHYNLKLVEKDHPTDVLILSEGKEMQAVSP